MRLTYYDFHENNETRRRFTLIPTENTLIHDFHAWVVLSNFPSLLTCQTFTNLDDRVSCTLIHFWVPILEEVQDVQSESPIPRTDFVDDEIFIGKVLQKIL